MKFVMFSLGFVSLHSWSQLQMGKLCMHLQHAHGCGVLPFQIVEDFPLFSKINLVVLAGEALKSSAAGQPA
jgi:hypothetical protein